VISVGFGIHLAEKRFTVDLLTGLAVAVFRVEGFLPTELVLDFTAVTASFITGMEIGVVFVYPIGSAEFPLIVLAIQVPVVPVVPILPVMVGCHGSCLSHGWIDRGMGLKMGIR
jgi:hypothetical protein